MLKGVIAPSLFGVNMEHIFHVFGGGCGEHMVWPLIFSFLTGGAVYFRRGVKGVVLVPALHDCRHR